jgi:hypothetical protein
VHKLTPEQVAARIRAIPVTPEGCRIGSELYATDKDGYPLLKSGGVMWRASRFVLTQKLGRPIAPGMQACHTCDNPACISEEHLWEGSHEDNQKDASSKGRKPVGHGHSRPLRKLNEQQVREIRDLYSAGGTSHSKLSAQYGVSPGAIEKVVTRRSWKWLD